MKPTGRRAPKADPPLVAARPLTEVINVTALQELQDRFAALGRMSVCICALDGRLLTRPTWGSRYSALIGISPKGQADLSRAILKSVQSRDPDQDIPLLEGMILHATPIVDGSAAVLGVIMIGTRNHAPPAENEVRKIAAEYGAASEELVQAAADLDPDRGGTPEAIHRFADVLAHIIATLYSQANRINRQLADLRIVHELSDMLSGTLELQEILNLTVRRVVEVMPVKACAIRLLDDATGELIIKAVHNLSEEYLAKGPILLKNSMIDSAAFAGHTVYIEDAPHDPRIRYPENARREGIVSGLCVPLTYRGQTVGVVRVYTGRKYRFSDQEATLLRSIGSQAAAAILHSRLFRDQAEARIVKRQVEAAAQIQQRMIPRKPPERPHLELGCVYEPSLQLGGDSYDLIEFDNGRLGVCIADVMGKGLPAALLMSSIRSAIRAFALLHDDPAEVVRRLNRHLYHDTPTGDFATVVYGVISPDGRSFSYCNAGHPPTLLVRGETFTGLPAGGLAIGIRPDEEYERGEINLRKRDSLVLITDGVTEAMDFHGSAYGEERFRASLFRHRKLAAPQLARQLLWDVRRFAGLAEQSDDITIVVAKAV